MNAPIFDTCAICGRQAIRPGGILCRWHEIQALITLGYERMIERVKHPAPRVIGTSSRNISKGDYGKV